MSPGTVKYTRRTLPELGFDFQKSYDNLGDFVQCTNILGQICNNANLKKNF